MPIKKTVMAMAFMVCITFRLKLVGRLGSFFRKKYIYKFIKFLLPSNASFYVESIIS